MVTLDKLISLRRSFTTSKSGYRGKINLPGIDLRLLFYTGSRGKKQNIDRADLWEFAGRVVPFAIETGMR